MTSGVIAVLALLAAGMPEHRAERQWALAWILPAAGAQLVLHESSHALVPALRGDRAVDVRFFPEPLEGRFGEAQWSLRGHAGYDIAASAMPKLVDLALLTALGRAKRGLTSPIARGLVGALQIVALADFLQGTLVIWRPPHPWNDAWYLTRRLEENGVRLGKGGARAVFTAAAAAGVLLFVHTW